MTENRRITDKLPGQPLQWDEAASFAAAPAAGQAGLAKRLRAQAVTPFGPEGFALLTEAADELDRRAAPVAADTEQAIPEGWKLVPVEPTPEMIAAMQFRGDIDIAIGHAQFYMDAEKDYAAMLAAAPAAPLATPAATEKAIYDVLVEELAGPISREILRKVACRLATPADAGAGLTEELAQQVLNALTLAMTICDAVPTRLHKSKDSQLANIGMLVNAQDNGAHGYAVIREARAAFEQATANAAAIPKGAARSWNGTTYYNIEEMYHHFEDGEALHMWLDDKGVPRADAEGKVFSLVGRVARMSTSPAPVTAEPVRSIGLPVDLIHDFRDAIAVALDRAEQTGYTARKERWLDVRNKLELAVATPAPADRDAIRDQEQQWISVDERLPDGKNCLAVYETSRGQQHIIRAMHVPKFTVEAHGEDCYSEINDENDTEYLREGWYELIDNWGEYSSVHVCEGVVTHWMPLPTHPFASPTATDEKKGGQQ